MSLTSFIALYDAHIGNEIVNGVVRPMHDLKAIQCALKVVKAVKPDVLIYGGDMMDCGPVSRHLEGRHGRNTEGLRLADDFLLARTLIVDPVRSVKRKVYLTGNHEAWIEQWIDKHPEMEGLVSLDAGLGLQDWELIPQGGVWKLGKLHFTHGDIFKGTNPAKYAVESFERNVRFGHFHRYSAHTKISAIDNEDVKTGVSVPCLARRDPAYGRSAPNGHTHGFLIGHVDEETGNFWDSVVHIIDGRCVVNGKVYEG